MTDRPTWPDFADADSPQEMLVKLSRFYGADPAFVLAGGGNTSVKDEAHLWVKASGTSLAEIDESGFVQMDRDKLQDLLETDVPEDRRQREAEFKRQVLAARTDPASPLRPSVETVLHHLLPGRFVIHTHPAAANVLTCCAGGAVLAEELLGDEVIWVPFVDPGWLLARQVDRAVQEFRSRTGRHDVPPILMENHGLLVCGDKPEAIREQTDRLIEAVRTRLDQAGDAAAPFGPVQCLEPDRREATAEILAPLLRGLLGSDEALPIVRFDDSEAVCRLVGGAEGKAAAQAGPLSPDQIVYCLSLPLWIDRPETDDPAALRDMLQSRIAGHESETGAAPKILLVQGVGLFAVGDTFQAAETARGVYADAIEVMAGSARLGGIQPLSDEARRFIETWEVEAYRRKIAARQRAAGRAVGKIAIVTGAAQGFGLEIAQDLAAQGACVVLGDLNAEGAEAAAGEINASGLAGVAMGLSMNVTDSASIGQAVGRTVRAFGGLDLLVANAGVLKAESVKTQPEQDFDFVTSVNYKGYFLSVQGVCGVLARQHLARPGYFTDIIQINSKSGLAGSNKNFAYAGGKFGGIGLTQSFALELIEDGVKVNSIGPGNFFDGPLWSDPDDGLFVQYLRTGKVEGARTIDDVRRAYEAKVPMGRGCRTEDVMRAVYYLLEQKYETGQAVPVTGGQVMLR